MKALPPGKKARATTGRPRKNIDPLVVEQLASIDCSYAEMAAVLGCNESTLTRRFAQAIQKGRASGRASLKRLQYKVAQAGNVGMLIWLGKIRLGQVDTSKVVIDNRDLASMTDEELLAERKALGMTTA